MSDPLGASTPSGDELISRGRKAQGVGFCLMAYHVTLAKKLRGWKKLKKIV